MEIWNHALSQKIVLPTHWRLQWTSQVPQHSLCFWQFCYVVMCCVCVLYFCRVFCLVLLSEYLYSLCCPRFCHTSKVAEARCREYVKAFPPEIQTLPSLHMPTFNLNLQLKNHTNSFQSIENNANKNWKLKFPIVFLWLFVEIFLNLCVILTLIKLTQFLNCF